MRRSGTAIIISLAVLRGADLGFCNLGGGAVILIHQYNVMGLITFLYIILYKYIYIFFYFKLILFVYFLKYRSKNSIPS